MTRSTLTPAELSVSVPASTCARLRHGLTQMLRDAQRAKERIPDDVVETILQLDQLGAAWERQHKPDLSSPFVPIDPSPFVRVEWEAMTTKTASDELGITPQAVGQLLAGETLHGEKSGRTWRVCAESVRARKKGIKCQH